MKHKTVATQNDSYASAQLTDLAANCLINTSSVSQVAFKHIECVKPKIFPKKLYQSHALKIAEEYEQAIAANSLEKINHLLDKVLEIGHVRRKRQWVVTARRAHLVTKKK